MPAKRPSACHKPQLGPDACNTMIHTMLLMVKTTGGEKARMDSCGMLIHEAYTPTYRNASKEVSHASRIQKWYLYAYIQMHIEIYTIYYVKKGPCTIHIHIYIYLLLYICVCACVHLKINPTILPVSHLKYKRINEYHFTLHPSFVLAMPKKYHPNFNKAKRIMDIIIIIARVSSFQERVYRPTSSCATDSSVEK